MAFGGQSGPLTFLNLKYSFKHSYFPMSFTIFAKYMTQAVGRIADVLAMRPLVPL